MPGAAPLEALSSGEPRETVGALVSELDRLRAEAAMGRFKGVIGDGLRSRTDQRRATEVEVAVHVLNRMLELGRPESVRIA